MAAPAPKQNSLHLRNCNSSSGNHPAPAGFRYETIFGETYRCKRHGCIPWGVGQNCFQNEVQSLRKKSFTISKNEKRVIFILLTGSILFAIAITSIGFIDNNIQVETDHLTITGPHGMSIALNEIDSIYLTTLRPEAKRIRGYLLGYRKKGLFKNSKGEEFQMLINSNALPWIVIQKKDGFKIYYSHSRKPSEDIFMEIK